MYEPTHREAAGDYSEATLYEDLTDFIKIFKNVMTTAETLTFLIAKSEECTHTLRTLKELLGQNHSLINSYNYELDDSSPHRNTYFRFLCRILETLEVYRNRKYATLPIFSLFCQFVSRAEAVINSYKLNKNIGQLFRKVFALATRFCSSCESAMAGSAHEQAYQGFKKQAEEKGAADQNGDIHVRKIHFNNSESNFHKVMGGLTRRFATMSCLDLDYNSFKTVFFQSKNQKDELFHEMLQRNGFVYRQISLYSRQFQEYLKRREKQILRKNRFKEGKTLGNTFSISFKANQYNKSLDVTKILETEKEDTANSQITEQLPEISPLIHSKRIKTKQGDLCDDRFMQFQKRKTSYQIKNVYLTLNKIHTNSEFNQSYINHKNQRRNAKDKNKVYSILKNNKYALKSTKFAEIEPVKPNRPILEIRQIDYKNMQMKFDECMEAYQDYHTEGALTADQALDRINMFEKKNIRITQVLKKNSLNLKIRDESLLQELENLRMKRQGRLEQDLLH